MTTTMTKPKKPKKLAPLATRQRIACATHGHPPVIYISWGYVHCARCDAKVGDVLGGAFDTTNVVVTQVEGHENCEMCRRVWDGLTHNQRRLTPNPFTTKKKETA